MRYDRAHPQRWSRDPRTTDGELICPDRTPEEAVQRANNTTYGLSAGVWTEKAARALEMANRLNAGVVWLNTFNRFDATAPFGGYRESGFGREGGRQGLSAYLAFGAAAKGGRR
jgi:aldehyde dehydrogenase (NAD+)